MEFTVEVTEPGILTEPAITAPASSTPALDAATQEYTDIATNPQNARYEAFHRGDSQVSAYIDTLFKRAAPDKKPVENRNDGVASITSDVSEDTHAQAEVEAALRAAFGDSYDATMREMASGAKYLFDGEGGQETLTFLSDRLVGLGARAEVLGIRFLADLAKLQQP